MGYVCKMCGKLLNISEEKSICECEYCGSRQTVPRQYDDRCAEIYNRACRLRFKTDFEGAENLFSQLCEEFPDEPEGYWGKILCRCGILYEDEAVSGIKLPVCHLAYGTSLNDDRDCCTALSLADSEQSAFYRREISAIEMLRKETLERVGTGVIYDVYICCRTEGAETSEDKLIADEIYSQLIKEGLRVFYYPETIGDKYENASDLYIFAAIKCASTLLVVSAESENFADPKFRREWSRCVATAKKDGEKLVITCIKNTDNGDVPAELSDYRIMDVAEMSFLAELIRSVKSHSGIAEKGQTFAARSTPEKLIRRMNIFLADEDFEAAEEYSDMIIDVAPQCWQAHFVKFLAFNGCRSGNDLLIEEVVSSFADDYIQRFGFDFADDEAFEQQFVGMLGDNIKNAVEFADGDDKLMISTFFDRFVSAVRDAVFMKEQEKIEGEEKIELDKIRRRYENEKEERIAFERKKVLVRKRFLTYVAVAVGILLFPAIKFGAKWAALLIAALVVLTLIVLVGLGNKKEKRLK